MKQCIKCGETKQLANFGKNRVCKSGYVNSCKDCVKKYQKKYRETYTAPASLVITKRRGTAVWKDRNRVQVRANKIVYAAVRDGRLTRTACEVCGNRDSEGHHDDYNFPLSVRWLCRAHHQEWHRTNEPTRP